MCHCSTVWVVLCRSQGNMAYVGDKEQHRRWLIFLLKMYRCQVPSISLLACRAVVFFFFHGNQQFISVAEACHLYASPFCLDFSLNFLLKNINIFIYIYILQFWNCILSKICINLHFPLNHSKWHITRAIQSKPEFPVFSLTIRTQF